MNRQETLDKAGDLIHGDRAKDYGDAYDNHERIAEGWNIILKKMLMTHGYFTAAHVALMMDWVKTSRLLETITTMIRGSIRQVTRHWVQNLRHLMRVI